MKERLKNYFRIVITMFENWPPRLIFSHFGKRQFKKTTIKKNNKNVYFLKNSREQKCEKVVFFKNSIRKIDFFTSGCSTTRLRLHHLRPCPRRGRKRARGRARGCGSRQQIGANHFRRLVNHPRGGRG